MLLLILTLFPIFIACLGRVLTKKAGGERLYYNITLSAAIIEFVLVMITVLGEDISISLPGICGLGLNLELDGFRRVYIVVLSFMWMITTAFSKEYFSGHHNLSRMFFFLMMTEGSIIGVFLASDLVTALVFFEIMSFTSFPWVIQEETDSAIRAANTYLAIAVIGGLASLFGIFLVYNKLGTVVLAEIYAAAKLCPDRSTLYIAGGCILAGFGAKAGMFPLHIWLPKAHPVAPAPASALLSGALTKSGIWGIIAISSYIFRADPAWGMTIVLLGTVTMFLGAVLALFSVDLKRTLACSSMSQIGFILIGIGMMDILGAESALATRGALLHMMNHSLFKLVLFICAGVVFMNTEELDLNKIRGFGRGKLFLNICFLLGAAGIAGIPGLNGYISKTLLHESIVEGIHSMGHILKVVEWVFLISGGLTLAYMTKLYICIFVQKPAHMLHEEHTPYMSPMSRIALGGAAALIPVLGLTAHQTMDRIAEIATDFFAGGHLEHEVAYMSLENLKGGLISIAIGVLVYLIIVRLWMIKDGVYIDRWPKRLDLEELVYRPLLLKVLPGIFGTISAFVSSFFEVLIEKLHLLSIIGAISHAFSDIVDGFIYLLRRTIYKDTPEHDPGKAESSLSYRIGEKVDHALIHRGKEEEGSHRKARFYYRITHTLGKATRDLFDSMSFALLILVLALCLILAYVLVIYQSIF